MYLAVEIHWTCASYLEAKNIINDLINLKLIACAHIIKDIQSIYIWKGCIEENTETKVVFKTFENFYSEIKKHILEKGSYLTPEISMIILNKVNEDYFRWMKEILIDNDKL